jgi:hypothetical protein
MKTFIDVVSRWKDNPELAADLGVTSGLVACWKHRDNIPAEHWPNLVSAAKARGWADITYDLLGQILAEKKGVRRFERSEAA